MCWAQERSAERKGGDTKTAKTCWFGSQSDLEVQVLHGFFYVFVSGFLLMANLELAVYATWFSLGNPPRNSGHMWLMIRVACVLEL